MHDRGHKGLRERAARPLGWLRRRWRRAMLVVAVLALVPLGSDAARNAMAGDGWNVGEAFGTGVAFDEIYIDEPLPDEVVDAGYAPDPGFFSDDEISGSLGDSGIPEVALEAYLDGADLTNEESPGCGLPWSVLAAIGRVESNHGRFGGAMLRVDGYGTKPIRGIALDGRPGIALVRDTDRGRLDGDDIYDRAVGPMQIIPSTWDAIGVDANEDDRSDPNNIFDAAWGAGIYLCNGDVDLTEPGQLARAVRRYNHTDEYVRVVLELASAYDSGAIEPSPGVDPATLGETPMDPIVFRDFEDVDPGPLTSYYDPDEPAPADPSDPTPAPAPPAPAPPAPPPAPAPPAPAPPAPAPPPAPPAPTTTAPAPAPTTTVPAGPTTTTPPRPAPPTPPTPPTTVPGGPGTTVPGGPGTTAPPTTDVPAPTTTVPPDDPIGSIPPASVGWSPTMLDFVTTTVAERAADCSAPEPSPAPTQPSVPAPNPPCPAATPPVEGQS